MKNKNSFIGFLFFEVLITPKIIVLLYWGLTTMSVIGLILALSTENDRLFGVSLVVIVISRIAFEMVMLAFKNNEYARRSCEAMELLVKQNQERERQEKEEKRMANDADFESSPGSQEGQR